ncbi:MAG: hypothetical protein HYY76_00120 [Acidobacteria bacterium]|nr:hypothetical protein [Acidobacteriota bacterium]
MFQIWPHAVQRQYVETFTSLAVVLTSGELQKGQALGVTVASSGLVYTRLPISALWIVSLPEPLFGYPSMADRPEVEILIAPKP